VKYLFANTSDTDAVGFFYPYGGTNGNDADFVAPTIGVNYKITEDLAVYGAFGQNIKFPDITAYYNGIPGTTAAKPPAIPPVTVKPEHVNDYELGLRYQHEGVSGSLALYREDFSDTFIDKFDPKTYLTRVSNGGTSRYQGVELQMRDSFGDFSWGNLTGNFNFAYNQAKFTSSFSSDSVGGLNSDADVQVYAGEAIADVPDYLVSGGVVWTYNDWRISFDGRYVGSQYADDLVSGVTVGAKIAEYTVFDLGVSKTVKVHALGDDSVKFSLNVNNLFNEQYYKQEYTEPAKYNFFGKSYLVASPGAPGSIIGSVELAF